MSSRVLTARALNRSVLNRQLLLERSSLSIPRALERIAGLQTQYAPSGYIGLWSRVDGFQRGDLTRALERKRVIQATLMRGTIHMVSARDYPLLAAGIARFNREWWQRQSRRSGLDARSFKDLIPHVVEALAAGPRRRDELIAVVESAGFPKELWGGLGFWLPMVRVPPSGTWERRRADRYALSETWLGPEIPSEEHGVEHLIRRYLRGFGPASLEDAANWAGVTQSTLAAVAERMGLRQFHDEEGETLVDLPRVTLPPADTPAPVRFLGTWEAILLVHARRSRVLSEDHRGEVFSTKNPHSVPTFLVDGSVAGTWRFQDGTVEVTPFEPLPGAVRAEVEEEAARLAQFHLA